MQRLYDMSLEAVLRRERLDLENAMQLAAGLAGALAAAHAKRSACVSLCPGNVMVDVSRAVVRLVAPRSGAGGRAAFPLPSASEEWPYMSPEQTGRMGRAVDFRSDFYSLGMILYRMFAGTLPFSAQDALEWAHCHIARVPVPLSEVAPGVPDAVSAIVMKLLAKNADDRYQSAGGLLSDLESCLHQWRRTGSVAAFRPGELDMSERFQVSQKLYGRQAELEKLLAVFDCVRETGRTGFATVSGPAAAGKSRLLQELQGRIAERRGMLISGKFDQYQVNIPYATLSMAFHQLVQYVLGLPESETALWRRRIIDAIQRDGRLIVDLIPQLELLIGPQPAVSEFPAREAKFRFQRAVRRFIGAVATAELPLLLVLDDMQWADAASHALVSDLVAQPEAHPLMLVVVYRDDAVGPEHPLQNTLAMLVESPDRQAIAIGMLSQAALEELVADTLRCSRVQAAPLAELIRGKTEGNPFFAVQLLQKLHQDGAIRFDRVEKCWCWDLQRITEAHVTDNVVELLAERIGQLAPSVRRVLEYAACLGSRFTTDELAQVTQVDPQEASVLLQPAFEHGLLLSASTGADRGGPQRTCKWAHDRIQQAVYMPIDRSDLARLHLEIANELQRSLPPAQRTERLFDIVGHLNAATELLSNESERIDAASLNLAAAEKARKAVAYQSALDFAEAGIALVPGDWQRFYDIAFRLHLLRAECELLTGSAQASKVHVDQLAANARSKADKVTIYRLKLQLHFLVGGKMADGAEHELKGLAECGYVLPESVSLDEVAAAAGRVMTRIGPNPRDAILALPAMNDPEREAPLHLPALSVFTDWKRGALRITHMVELCLDHGNCNMAVFWYGAFAACLPGPVFGDYELGYRYAEATCELMETLGAAELRAYAAHVRAVTAFWLQPLDTVIGYFKRAFEDAMECGDFNIGNYCAAVQIFYRLNSGDFLADVYEASDRALDFVRRSRSPDWLDMLGFTRQFICELQGNGPDPETGFDRAQFEASLTASRWAAVHLRYWCLRMRSCYLFGAYAQAAEIGERAYDVYVSSNATVEVRDYLVFHALTLAHLIGRMAPAPAGAARRRLDEYVKKLHVWSRLNPATFIHITALIDAELARIDGRHEEAARLYEESIRSARAARYIHDLALAYEVAARFYAERGFQAFADLYLGEARECYARWGAHGKLAQLDSIHPQLPLPAAHERPSATQLDLLSIIKVSQAISSEIRLDALLDILMRNVMENAGARCGHLLLARSESWVLEASALVERHRVHVRRRHGEGWAGEMPESVVNYVRRSREPVLLDDAGDPGQFAGDPYLAARRIKSVLCLPILRQSALIGMLYLENDLLARAFTRDRIALLELLVAQAAVSLDNAQLFDQLQRENGERRRVEAALREREARIRRLIESNIIGIFSWNISGRISEANDAFLQICGYSHEELLSGRVQWEALTPEAYKSADRHALEELRHSGRCTPYEKEFRRKDGSRVPVLLGATFDEGSHSSGMAFVLDLTERKQADAERAARRSAEAASQAKTAFLANISHELRSPLNTLLGFGRLLERNPQLPPDARADLATMLSSGEHLRTLINQVLDLAKIEAGRSTLNPSDFDLHALLVELEGMFALRADENGLLLECRHDGVPRMVRTDAVKLRQILINLLSNAFKFTPQGSVRLQVAAATGTQPMRLRFSVTDTGRGIEPDELKNLFNPFMQSRSGRQAREGTGLGLAISRDFVRLLGGDMRITSEVGKGTCVRFDIPVMPAEDTAPGASGSKRRVVALAPGQPRHRILVVDDRKDARQLLVRLLQPLGFELREAEDGEVAVALARAWQPHLVWMDMRMPVLDGRAATARIKAAGGAQSPVVIALSASNFAEERSAILDAGCDDFLHKPFREEELFGLLEKHLQIVFVHEEQAAPAAAVPAPPDMIALAELPDAVRDQLTSALHALDTDAVSAAIAQIGDRALAQALAALADEFQYHQILQLLGEPGQDKAS